MAKQDNPEDVVEQPPQPFEGFSERKGVKQGGAHKPDPEAGRYKSSDGNTTYLIKRDIKYLENDVAEFLAAQVFDELSPGTACKLTLTKSQDTGRTFLASEYFKEGYRDFYTDLGDKDRSAGRELVEGYLPARAQHVRQGLAQKDEQGNFVYQNYEPAVVSSLLLADQSIHSGNIGVVNRGNPEKPHLVRIDFGAAFREFEPDINPFKSNKAHVVLEKNYFLRDHPRKRIFTEEFSAELKRQAKVDLGPRIDQAWQKIVENYDNETERGAIVEFGKQVGAPESVINEPNKNKQFDGIKSHFAKRMEQRQESQLDMAVEIDLKLALGKGTKNIDYDKLKAAIAENPTHVERILEDPAKSQWGLQFSKAQKKVLAAEVEAYRKEQKDVRHDLAKGVNYFDEMLEQMEAKAKKNNLDIDFAQYEPLKKQWRDIFSEAQKSLPPGVDIDPAYSEKIIKSLAVALKGVNREYIDYFLKRPEHYQKQWEEHITSKGKAFSEAVKEAGEYTKSLQEQRESVQDLSGQTRTARLHNLLQDLEARTDNKDLKDGYKSLIDKIEKGHDVRSGKYDFELDTETYMKLFASAHKIKNGVVPAKEEFASMREGINDQLPLSRKIGSALSSKEATQAKGTQQHVGTTNPLEEANIPETTRPRGKTVFENPDLQKKTVVTPELENVEPPKKKAVVTAELATDRVIIPVTPVASQKTVTRDSIEQVIRDEVIIKQQLYVQQEVAKHMPVGNERNKFSESDLGQVREYLETPQGKQVLVETLKDPKIKHDLQVIETNGYKAVHSQFQDSFKDLSWKSGDTDKTKVTAVKDDQNVTVLSLKETTVENNPQSFKLGDGTTKQVSGYRSVDFPKTTDNGTGPVHFSMALKDENGQSMPKKDAVYFTAHYDDKGKLTEVSSPVPVKFMGQGKDAIGYIEKDNKIFTLPVTKGKYDEMVKEVAANKGLAANLSYVVEPKSATTKLTKSTAEHIGKDMRHKLESHPPSKPRPRSKTQGLQP